MLYPVSNEHRTAIDLSGIWELKIDRDDFGIEENYTNGFTADHFIAVPGSWNEQLAEQGLMNYIGVVWYQTQFHTSADLNNDQKVLKLRFDSAEHEATAWVNGKQVGHHQGGFLPFEFDITDALAGSGANRLVVRLDNNLDNDTIPQGVTIENFDEFNRGHEQTYPPVRFDFFNYGGLNRPVRLLCLNKLHLNALIVDTPLHGDAGEINFQCFLSGANGISTVRSTIIDRNGKMIESISSRCTDSVTGNFQLAKCNPWSPDDPYLYELLLEVIKNDVVIDSYSLEVGIREIIVERDKLLINGKPVFLRGFGKHEDFPVLGKGLSYPLIVKDFELMKWVGANSFRTSHYPYAEEMIIQADRLGFLIIDEVPAVSLNFRHTTDKTIENHKISLTELIMRDRNHPSVISWSVANEPGIWGEEEAFSNSADEYWREIINHVHELDSTRPTMLPSCAAMGLDDPSLKYVDIIALNRYYGWYEFPGDLGKACRHLKEELIDFYTKFQKPVMLTEFGADTIPGEHATYDNLFTEEYQAALIEAYFDVIESLPFMIGEHIWNFADFRTSQHHRRMVLNRKGVFDRYRDPKRAAFLIRDRWTTKKKHNH